MKQISFFWIQKKKLTSEKHHSLGFTELPGSQLFLLPVRLCHRHTVSAARADSTVLRAKWPPRGWLDSQWSVTV